MRHFLDFSWSFEGGFSTDAKYFFIEELQQNVVEFLWLFHHQEMASAVDFLQRRWNLHWLPPSQKSAINLLTTERSRILIG